MTLHRYIYKCCWKNKSLLTLLALVCMVFVVTVVLRDTSIEYAPSGRIRFKYHVAAPSPQLAGQREGRQPLAQHDRQLMMDADQLGQHEDPLREVRLVWADNHAKIEDDPDDEIRVHQIVDPIVQEHRDYAMRKVENYVMNQHGDLDNNIQGLGMAHAPDNHHKRVSLDILQKSLQGQESSDQMRRPEKVKNKHLIRKKKKSRLKFKPVWRKDVYYNASNPPELFKTWNMYVDSFCDGNFVGYFNEFVHVKNVVVDKEYIFSDRVGGEKLRQVMNQPEEAEYFTYELGAFEQKCSKRPSYYFNNNNHMNDWLYSLKTLDASADSVDIVREEFVLAIVRYEYVNIYHTMSDWYNAFLMMQMFNKTQWQTNIVLFDAHPQGTLDSTWLVLFNTTQRLTMLPKRTLFTNMVWNILGYNSPMLDHYGPGMPLIEEFREFILTSFDVKNNATLNCAELKILFIWRRDYVAHPRNPTGSISRKIFNERDLMKSVQEKYPSFSVRGMQIDLFDMQKQLSTIVQTDILIGMHGAGLTHAMFLPQHAAVIEMIPSYWSTANDHFYAISKWRNLIYERWSNEDPHNEAPNMYTKIPIGVMHSLIKSAMKKMCYKDN